MAEPRLCCGIWIDFACLDGHDGDSPPRPPMPVERRSAGQPGGNLAIRRDPGGVLRYRVLRAGEEPGPGEKRGVSHFATCRDAAAWRKRGPA